MARAKHEEVSAMHQDRKLIVIEKFIEVGLDGMSIGTTREMVAKAEARLNIK